MRAEEPNLPTSPSEVVPSSSFGQEHVALPVEALPVEGLPVEDGPVEDGDKAVVLPLVLLPRSTRHPGLVSPVPEYQTDRYRLATPYTTL